MNKLYNNAFYALSKFLKKIFKSFKNCKITLSNYTTYIFDLCATNSKQLCFYLKIKDDNVKGFWRRLKIKDTPVNIIKKSGNTFVLFVNFFLFCIIR